MISVSYQVTAMREVERAFKIPTQLDLSHSYDLYGCQITCHCQLGSYNHILNTFERNEQAVVFQTVGA